MAYLRFEANPDEDLDFVLAEIMGCPVAVLHDVVSNEEFVRWGVFLARRKQRQELM